jgi:gluconate 2-dehydrogenase gamma chain
MSDDQPHFTRRHLLQGATLVGAAVATPMSLIPSSSSVNAAEVAQVVSPVVPREAFETLTATESDLLEAVVERLIPSDTNGPGAKEARAAHYIDRALSGALASSRNAYASGLEALDRYARSSRGKSFLELPPIDQDSVLIDCETGGATGFTGSSAQFFAMLLNHTRQGTFGDPYYGGNANFVGWDLINYPGVRTAISAADQKALEANELKPMRKSAYDYNGFNKATAGVDTNDMHEHLVAGAARHAD